MNETTTGEPRLRAPRHRVSHRAVGWWSLRAGVVWLVLVAAQLLIRFTAPGSPTWLAVTAIICAALGVAHVLVMPQWRYRVHRFEITPEAVYTLSGWFNQEWRVAPVSRIQTVDTKRGPLEQLLGLATVTVTTASAAGPLKINGMDHDAALRLVDELTTTTQATSGDAT
ncbi:MAG: PH domain-containing protein [Sciscionella sp.]